MPLAGDSVTVKLTSLPSAAAASATLSDGAPSSSAIVPVPVPSPSVAFVGPLSVTVNVSSASSVVSSAVLTVNVFEVSPGANDSVPVSEPARSPVSAVSETPPAVAVHVTPTVSSLATDSVTVKVSVPPSLPDTSFTLSVASSSSVIVPVAVASASVAFVGLDSVSLNVSSASSMVSLAVGTAIVPVVEPAGIVSVRSVCAVKSAASAVVPPGRDVS